MERLSYLLGLDSWIIIIILIIVVIWLSIPGDSEPPFR